MSAPPRSASTPLRTWVLVDDRPGNETQARGLAEALGAPFEIRRLRFRAFADRQIPFAEVKWLDALPSSTLGLDRERSDSLAPPWPDLIIAAGARCAPVARWLRRRTRGRTRVVLLGRKAGLAVRGVDLVVTPRYAMLPPHPRRIETTAPLHALHLDETERAARERPDLLAAPRPRIAALIGGRAGRYELGADDARELAKRLLRLVHGIGGSLLVTTSRRTGDAATAALAEVLEGDPALHLLHRFGASGPNPYRALLGAADGIVVTGESESMLSEAVATGRPVWIAPLRERPGFVRRRFREALRDRALQGYAGSRRVRDRIAVLGVGLGLALPPRDLAALHAELIERGAARWLDESPALPAEGMKPLREVEEVAAEVRRRLGLEPVIAPRAGPVTPESQAGRA